MHKLIRNTIFVSLLVSSICSWSQQDEYSDTTRMPPVELIEDEEANFSIITNNEPVEIRKLPKDKLSELKESDDYWYANIAPQKKQEQTTNEDDSIFAQQWFQNLLWVIILCSFIGAVIWYLASSNMSLFRKESKKIEADADGLEEWTDDIFAINYEKEIQKAVSLQNYRLAVRLLYLRTLRDLSQRNIIDYRFGRTNSDYVNALFGGRYHRDFFQLTRNFEYTWYGQFKPSAEVYEAMQADFMKFKNSMA